jgi:hypothetical protein
MVVLGDEEDLFGAEARADAVRHVVRCGACRDAVRQERRMARRQAMCCRLRLRP